MKILNWIHSRFHHRDAKKGNNDTISLLENEALEGILSIGTFGVDLYQDFKRKDVSVMFIGCHKHNDDDNDHEEEMESPLVQKACKHGFEFEYDHVQKHAQYPLPTAKPKNCQKGGDVDIENAKKTSMKSGKRTTLADLLRADSEDNLLNLPDDDHNLRVYRYDNNRGKESICKSSLISKKKEKLRKDDSRCSFNKTNQLMRKMLKKKIHPDSK